jgi:hypothetical protein
MMFLNADITFGPRDHGDEMTPERMTGRAAVLKRTSVARKDTERIGNIPERCQRE